MSQLGDAIRSAFEEGYLQGAAHPKGRSVIIESKRISASYWGRVCDQANELFMLRKLARASSTPGSESE